MVTKKTFNSRMGKGVGKKQGFSTYLTNNFILPKYINKNLLRVCYKFALITFLILKIWLQNTGCYLF